MKYLDVVVLCNIGIHQSEQTNQTYSQLAEETYLRVGEAHASVNRLTKTSRMEKTKRGSETRSRKRGERGGRDHSLYILVKTPN